LKPHDTARPSRVMIAPTPARSQVERPPRVSAMSRNVASFRSCLDMVAIPFVEVQAPDVHGEGAGGYIEPGFVLPMICMSKS
jgi:hypothetical protein